MELPASFQKYSNINFTPNSFDFLRISKLFNISLKAALPRALQSLLQRTS
jgi:hypothetical protein